MKKILPFIMLAALFLGLTIFSPQADASSKAGLVKVVKSKTTVIYEKPSTSAKKVLTLSQNTPVVQLSQSSGWSRVQVGDKIGYTQMSKLKVKSATYRAMKKAATIKSSKASKAKTLVTVPKDAAVKNYGSVGNGLIFVQYGDYSGYLAASATKATTNSTAYPTYSDTMFSLPNEQGDVVTFLSMFTKVQVLSKGDKYSFIKVGSKYGYVQTSYLVNKIYQATAYLPDCKLLGSTNCKKVATNHVKTYQDGYEFMDYRIVNNIYYATLDSQFEIIFPIYKGTSMPIELAGGQFNGVVTNVGLTKKYNNKTVKNVFELSLYEGYTNKLNSKYYFGEGYGLLLGVQ